MSSCPFFAHALSAGTDFDFARNTRQVAPALKKEEELYIQQNDIVGTLPIPPSTVFFLDWIGFHGTSWHLAYHILRTHFADSLTVGYPLFCNLTLV